MKLIGVSSPLISSGLWRMLDALSEVLDVRFEERTFGDDKGIDAWLLHESSGETLCRLAPCTLPIYVVINENQRTRCSNSSTIEFSRHPVLPSVLHDKQIKNDETANLKVLHKHSENMTVLASKGGAPVWAMQEVKGKQHHYVALSVPELNEEEPLFQYFHGRQFLQLLPLILFLRALTEDNRWEHPPLHACFMIDDPNLHWRTYGFVDFAKIAGHARKYNYHVSFATIPQDTWFFHKPTARLFQQCHDHLSLLIHGNDHTVQELARPCSDEERNRNLRQALKRVAKFEQRSGVEISRVMVPPHGACSERTLREMADLGFEAACISRGSLRRYNGRASWLRTLGMRPSDIIGGLPVFPRFPFSGSCYNSILIAALLHQPIIARGHQHDIAEGLQLFANVSSFVNSIGTVQWAGMKQISRSHYARRLNGNILNVKMFTKHIDVCVPEGVSQIWVERKELRGEESLSIAWKSLSNGSAWQIQNSNEPIPVIPFQNIEIAYEQPTSKSINTKNSWNLHLWPLIRRNLTEVRDRVAPLLR